MELVKRRSSKTADYKYVQIADDLKGKIKSSYYGQERPFPSQAQIMKEYDVSLLTVRQVLNKLQGDGLIESYRGKGTFIKDEADISEMTWDRTHFIGLACVGGNVTGYALPNSRYVEFVKYIQSNHKELLTWYGSDIEELKRWSQRVDTLLLYNYVTNAMVSELKRCVPNVIVVGCLDEAAPRYEVSCFDYDLEASGVMGMDLLVKAGRRRIAYANDDTRHYANVCMRDGVFGYAQSHGLECREFIYPFEHEKLIAQRPEFIEQIKAYKPDAVLIKGGGSKLLYYYSWLTHEGFEIPRDLSLISLGGSPLEADPESLVRIRKFLPPDTTCNIADVTVIHGDSQMFTRAVEFVLNNKKENLIVHQTAAPQIHFGKSVGLYF